MTAQRPAKRPMQVGYKTIHAYVGLVLSYIFRAGGLTVVAGIAVGNAVHPAIRWAAPLGGALLGLALVLTGAFMSRAYAASIKRLTGYAPWTPARARSPVDDGEVRRSEV
jgi:hypothetical protein